MVSLPSTAKRSAEGSNGWGRRAHRPSRWLLAFLIGSGLALSSARPISADHRHFRSFDGDDGLDVTDVRSLAQDTAGFLWIGTLGGLYRFDGVEMRPWAPEGVVLPVTVLAAGPGGQVVAVDQEGALYAVEREEMVPVPGKGGEAVTDAAHAAFDGGGRLWVVRSGGVHFREPGGRWSVPEGPAPGEEVEWVFPVADRGLFVAGEEALWRLASGGFEKVAEVEEIEDVAAAPGGGLVVMSRMRFWETPRVGGAVVRIREEGVEELVRMRGARGIRLAVRGDTVWASFDRYLVSIAPDGAFSTLDPEDGIPGGGPLLVDREGSLWLGTFAGLLQFPEPGTRIWGEGDGLPSEHTRFLAGGEEGLWVSTWQGMGSLRRAPGGWSAAVAERRINRYELCADARGRVWAGVRDSPGAPYSLTRLDDADGRPRRVAGPLTACHRTGSGELWMGTQDGELLVLDPGGEPRRVTGPPSSGPDPRITALTVDREDRLWLGSQETVCHASRREVREGGAPWSCQQIPGARHVHSMASMPSGALWLATEGLGVLRRESDRWEPVPGSRELPSREALNLVPSSAGGIWVLSHAIVQRVLERPGTAAGWEVVERLGHWHGTPAVGAWDLMEDAEGALWLTTRQGVVRVPARARSAAPPPPAVELVDVRVDERRLSLDEAPRIPYERNRVELRYAALSFRDPSLLRYQVRVSEGQDWREVSRPTFRFMDLPPGDYLAEVRASLDGESWTEPPATYAFSVAPPWWRRAWVMAAFALCASAALYGLYRWRLGFLLELERQRTRIAMDLHDEMGSGLGSIGILAEVMGHAELGADERARMAREIVATAEELGASLSDIVWSLRHEGATLEELVAKLREHGSRLFADREVAFVCSVPRELPGGPLGLSLRRNLLLIGLEALHNASRHAGASRVELSLQPDGDGRWRLEVADDGVGLPEQPEGGSGLENMERRAREIGADLSCGRRHPRGTHVTLVLGQLPPRQAHREGRPLGLR